MEKKIAVIFPGIGYRTDRPLLYYTAKIAKQNGYEIHTVDFSAIDKSVLTDRTKLIECFSLAAKEAEEQLKDTDLKSASDVVFISKSIGTVAASICAARMKIDARQVFFTPFEQTFSLMGNKETIAFFGTADPFVEGGKIEAHCREKHVMYKKFTGFNHSLECGDLSEDLKVMAEVIETTLDFLVGAPIYRVPVLKRNKEISDLKEFRGKILLIINSATGCGYTPQYEALEEMYRKYRDKGFEILDFPCNQFGNQAEGSDSEIHSFCTARYDISFPQFAKIEVNGENATELFTLLKKRQGFRGFLLNSKESVYLQKKVSQLDPNYLNNSDIKWNFTKFLVNRRGIVVDRFEPDAGTDIVEQGIEKLLNED